MNGSKVWLGCPVQCKQPQRAGAPKNTGPCRAGARENTRRGLGGAERGTPRCEPGTGSSPEQGRSSQHAEKGSAEVGTSCPPSPAGSVFSPFFPPQKHRHVLALCSSARWEQLLPLSVLARRSELPPRTWETPTKTSCPPKEKQGFTSPRRSGPSRQDCGQDCGQAAGQRRGSGLWHRVVRMREGAGLLPSRSEAQTPSLSPEHAGRTDACHRRGVARRERDAGSRGRLEGRSGECHGRTVGRQRRHSLAQLGAAP